MGLIERMTLLLLRYVLRQYCIDVVREISIKDIPDEISTPVRGYQRGDRYVSQLNCLNSCDSTTFHRTILVMNTVRYLHSSLFL